MSGIAVVILLAMSAASTVLLIGVLLIQYQTYRRLIMTRVEFRTLLDALNTKVDALIARPAPEPDFAEEGAAVSAIIAKADAALTPAP